jgi:hypothetical protein
MRSWTCPRHPSETYVYLEDFDGATKELCRECALIRQIVPQDSIGIKITKEDHRGHWRKTKEETLSSKSGMHFGHYIAGFLSEYIHHFHALKAMLLLHHGLVLDCWAQGLSVMLQKISDAHSSLNSKPSYSWRWTSWHEQADLLHRDASKRPQI